MNAHIAVRPEGPTETGPGRQAWVKDRTRLSTEGAALDALLGACPSIRRSRAHGLARSGSA